MKKSVFILTIVLVLTFMVTLTASATQPTEIRGYFDEYVTGDPTTPTVWCIHTGENYGEPDGFIDGCVATGRRQGSTVGRKGNRLHVFRMSIEIALELSGTHVPELDGHPERGPV